jgi:hypothetical protein
MKTADVDAIVRAVADWALHREDIRAMPSSGRGPEAIPIRLRTSTYCCFRIARMNIGIAKNG